MAWSGHVSSTYRGFTTVRRIICRIALALALAGWGGALQSWLEHGPAAGVNVLFITGLAVGMTGTLAWVISSVMPDQAALYGLGFRDGAICADCPVNRDEVEVSQPRRRLTVV